LSKQAAVKTFGPLVSAAWLADHIGDPAVRVIDFRWYLTDAQRGAAEYKQGHLPGAVFVNLEEVTGHLLNAGRHPLPTKEDFERVIRSVGVNNDSAVVVYDAQSGFPSARLWWLMKYFGHDQVAILDGGLGAWTGHLTQESASPGQGDFRAREPRSEMVAEAREIAAHRDSMLLLDARAPERYRGEVEPVDPVAGHIPGAVNAPYAANLEADGRFLAAARLRERYGQLAVGDGRDVVVYCGSGVSACHNLIALELIGVQTARLYPGSWSEWSGRAGAPIETGDGHAG
jgi:thiosulfate/3-mercaptopyruvate sulfurtransferase